jgi:hypothetical protein
MFQIKDFMIFHAINTLGFRYFICYKYGKCQNVIYDFYARDREYSMI